MSETSTRPYLIRAIHEWCTDNGFRPFIAVTVDERTVVPREFIRDGEIVLNVSAGATNRLRLGNDLIEFEARFSGAVRQVSVPVECVSAIYASENGHGMAFDLSAAQGDDDEGNGVREGDGRDERDGRDRDGEVPAASDADGQGAKEVAPVPGRTRHTLTSVPSSGAVPSGEANPARALPARKAPTPPILAPVRTADEKPEDLPPDPGPAPGGRPKLTRIK